MTGVAAQRGAPAARLRVVPQSGRRARRPRVTCVGLPSEGLRRHADRRTTRRPASRRRATRAIGRATRRGRATAARGFNHNAFFPLVGVHATQTCATCHKNNVYKGTPRDCVGCHQADYNRTQNPNHVAAGFPTTCDTCHQPTDPQWAGRRRSITTAVFALVGVARHAGLRGVPQEQRLQGHAARLRRLPPGRLQPRRRTRTTRRPGSRRRATPATADRPAVGAAASSTTTAFVRAGRRARDAGVRDVPQEQRLQGHAARLRRLPSGRLQPRAEPEPRGGRVPDDVRHAATRRPTRSGRARRFNHSSVFALVGVHAVAGVRGVPREQRLQGHAARLRRLPPGQLQRHAEPEPRGGRVPDDVRHLPPGDRLDVAAGDVQPHAVPADAAHTTSRAHSATRRPNNFAVFSCTVCHDRSSTDSQHRGVNGYRYDSIACYACHPRGRS